MSQSEGKASGGFLSPFSTILTTTHGPLTYSQLCRAAWLQRELQSLSLWIMLWWDSSPASHISSKGQSLIQSLTGSQIHLCSFLLPPPERKALKLWWPLIPLKAYCGLYDRVAQAKCRPTEDHLMWSTVGCLRFMCYTLQTQQCRPSPCLSLPLFLIIELNGIKSFSIGILFSALALLNNLRGILTCYYPLTQCRHWK